MPGMVYVLRYLAVVVYTVLWGIPATLIGPFDRGGRIICFIARHWVGWIFATCGVRVEVEGSENVDPGRPCVLMGNHQSVFDIGAAVLTLPLTAFRFVAKRELGYIPFFGWALASSVGIMVDRANHERSVKSLRAAARAIVENGWHVVIYPEGTRSRDGSLKPFKSGGFHLAQQSQVPIVPVTVSGSRHITPKGALRIEPGVLRIVYGKPISTARGDEDDAGHRERLKAEVRAAIDAGFDRDLQATPSAP